jgi:hypothetical protein
LFFVGILPGELPFDHLPVSISRTLLGVYLGLQQSLAQNIVERLSEVVCHCGYDGRARFVLTAKNGNWRAAP